MRKAIVILIILPLISCLKEDALNIDFENYFPVALNDGLEISTPAEEGIDPLALNDIYELTFTDDRFWSIRSLLIFRKGRLVSECYHKDPQDISNPHLIWSCTKQVLAILTGIALEQGIINSLDDPISEYIEGLSESHPEKAQISIRNLLMMKSGIDYENDGVDGETDHLLRQIPEDMTDFILSRPMLHEPGTYTYYKDGDPHLLASLLQEQLGEPLDAWAERVLFSKIGIEILNWVRYKDGTSLGGYGLETTPREMAKIALLVQNKGIVGSDTMVSPSWVDEMIQAMEEQYSFHLGYYWWSDQSRNVHYMNGHGGQYAFIFPDKELLVVISAIPNTQGGYQLITTDALDLTDLIVNACEPEI